ncbi:unknown [Firmicutes bacterium CAG:822]|nr:unknown [Firmicutes bacterium CAG:822]
MTDVLIDLESSLMFFLDNVAYSFIAIDYKLRQKCKF